MIFCCELIVHITDTRAQKVVSCTSAHNNCSVSHLHWLSVFESFWICAIHNHCNLIKLLPNYTLNYTRTYKLLRVELLWNHCSHLSKVLGICTNKHTKYMHELLLSREKTGPLSSSGLQMSCVMSLFPLQRIFWPFDFSMPIFF